MNKISYTGMIEDIRQERCSAHEIEILMSVFAKAVFFTAKSSPNLQEEPLKISNFINIKANKIANYNLTLKKSPTTPKWTATFTHEKKQLTIVGNLKED